MKNSFVTLFLLAFIQVKSHDVSFALPIDSLKTNNVFIITTDGFRWQELFEGADSTLINDVKFTGDTGFAKAMFWHPSAEVRRKSLMPFIWNVIGKRGQLYGNRKYDNLVNAQNGYRLSYPGYSEIFTGVNDPVICSNNKNNNPNINVLEYLNDLPGFQDRVAAFSSWDVFPYILGSSRSDLYINSGYAGSATKTSPLISLVQDELHNKQAVRYDELTFVTAKDYLNKYRPRVLYLALGETDEFAHDGQYDRYLQQANKVDQMIAELWCWVQSTEGYKDNTTFIITTDHGRGNRRNTWTSHGQFIKGSSQTWLAILGPRLTPLGEVQTKGQLYQQQIARTISFILGEDFPVEQ